MSLKLRKTFVNSCKLTAPMLGYPCSPGLSVHFALDFTVCIQISRCIQLDIHSGQKPPIGASLGLKRLFLGQRSGRSANETVCNLFHFNAGSRSSCIHRFSCICMHFWCCGTSTCDILGVLTPAAEAAGKGWPSQQTSFPQILRLGFCLSLAPGTPPKSIE